MSRRGRTDWGALGGLLVGLAIIVAVVAAVWWITQQPTCYGIEPDGEVETLWPCPYPDRDGQRFPITEDEFADREIE